MKRIHLKDGKFTLVDDDDFDRFSKFKWYLNGTNSVIGRMKKGAGKVYHLHRVIMDAPRDKQIDHINHNTLDNRKSNLRFATQAENNRNQRVQKNCKSGIKGVYWRPEKKRWRAVLRFNGKIVLDNMFINIEDAANARRVAAIKYQGEFALESTQLGIMQQRG